MFLRIEPAEAFEVEDRLKRHALSGFHREVAAQWSSVEHHAYLQVRQKVAKLAYSATTLIA